MTFDIRRVVTGRDNAGRQVVVSDGTPRQTTDAATGHAASTLLWLPAPPATADDGGDPDGAWSLEPPAGGICSRIVRLPPPPAGATGDDRWLRIPTEDPSCPGMHATDTLDFMIVLDGEIVLGLDDGEHRLGPRDTVVQRGTRHRWRVSGDRPCTFFVTMLRRDPAADPSPLALRPRSTEPQGSGIRRLVTGADDEGRSHVTLDGEPPVVVGSGDPNERMMVDLWQTGGPLASCDQGGDDEADWQLDPVGGGTAFRLARLPAGQDPESRGWHVTDTIDIDLMLTGTMELSVPDSPPVTLQVGDIVVQRAVDHLWTPLHDEPVMMTGIMIGV